MEVKFKSDTCIVCRCVRKKNGEMEITSVKEGIIKQWKADRKGSKNRTHESLEISDDNEQ